MTPAYAVVTLHIPLEGTNYHDSAAVQEDKRMVFDAFQPVADSLCGTISVKIMPDNTDTICPVCKQKNVGQTGEHPCCECGLPTIWDHEFALGAHHVA